MHSLVRNWVIRDCIFVYRDFGVWASNESVLVCRIVECSFRLDISILWTSQLYQRSVVKKKVRGTMFEGFDQ